MRPHQDYPTGDSLCESVAAFVGPTARIGREPTDAEVIFAITRGDVEAVGIVWDRHSRAVRCVIRSLLGRDQAVDDLLQETFVSFLRSVQSLREPRATRGFLVGIAARVVSGEIRRRRVRRIVTLSSTGTAPDVAARGQDAESTEVLRALDRILQRMPRRRRHAFVLRQVNRLEIDEISEALEISESTVKREVALARQTINHAARDEPALFEYMNERASHAPTVSSLVRFMAPVRPAVTCAPDEPA